MHKTHFIGCGAALLSAVVLIALTGGSTGGYGLLLAVLACPIAMVLAMKILTADGHHHGPGAVPTSHHEIRR